MGAVAASSSGQYCLTSTEASARAATALPNCIFRTVAAFGYGKPFDKGTAHEKYRSSIEEASRLQQLEEENIKASGKAPQKMQLALIEIQRKYQLAFVAGRPNAVPKWITTRPDLSATREHPKGCDPKILTEAHRIFIQYQATCHMSTACRQWRASNSAIKIELTQRISDLVGQAQMEFRGAGHLRNCIASGWFLHVIAVHAAYRPIAMQSGTMMDDGLHGTLLTSALNASHDIISPSFIMRLLTINAEHRDKLKFDLLQHRTVHHGTPLHIITSRNAPDVFSIIGPPGSTVTFANYDFKANLKEIEVLLKSHGAPNLPPLPAPPVPAGPAEP